MITRGLRRESGERKASSVNGVKVFAKFLFQVASFQTKVKKKKVWEGVWGTNVGFN